MRPDANPVARGCCEAARRVVFGVACSLLVLTVPPPAAAMDLSECIGRVTGVAAAQGKLDDPDVQTLLREGMARMYEPPQTLTDLSAPDDMRVADLGRYYDRDVQPLNAWLSLSSSQRAAAAGPEVSMIASDCRRLRTTEEISASAHIWGTVEVDGSVSQSKAYATCRTEQTSRMHRLDVAPPSDAPKQAFYYVSGLREGRVFEVHVRGTESAVAARTRVLTTGASGTVRGSTQTSTFEERRAVKGLEPVAGALLTFSSSALDTLDAKFQQSGAPVATSYTLRALPSALARWRAERAKMEQLCDEMFGGG